MFFFKWFHRPYSPLISPITFSMCTVHAMSMFVCVCARACTSPKRAPCVYICLSASLYDGCVCGMSLLVIYACVETELMGIKQQHIYRKTAVCAFMNTRTDVAVCAWAYESAHNAMLLRLLPSLCDAVDLFECSRSAVGRASAFATWCVCVYMLRAHTHTTFHVHDKLVHVYYVYIDTLVRICSTTCEDSMYNINHNLMTGICFWNLVQCITFAKFNCWFV